jgi:Ni,Fe-hydrogenase III large subunit/Ni,Fe-hydrogenase III component G
MQDFGLTLTPIPGPLPAWHASVDALQWRRVADQVQAAGGRLVALWGSDESERGPGFAVHVALGTNAGLLWLTLPVDGRPPEFPDLAPVFPAANRMQRAVYDLVGVRATDTPDPRRWLRHGAWPAEVFPLRKSVDAAASYPNAGDDYAFVQVDGEGVHEIPVGPVHAGTIEPGHFRFSIVGERTLRLEQRLGYKHKGIEKRFESLGVHDGFRLAGRVSGDSTVAYAWAYAMAAEGAAHLTPPRRALWLRALLLERERIANHLGDLGFLGNDAGLAFALAQLSRLKEHWLRTNAELFGHRYLMDCVVPGGVAGDLPTGAVELMHEESADLRDELSRMKSIFDEHTGLQDRLLTTGRVTPELAERLGLTGLAGRASGRPWDLRVQFPYAPYDQLGVNLVSQRGGDVAARVIVRFEEIFESLRLCDAILDAMPAGNIVTLFPTPEAGALGVGWVEGWRGDVLIALEAGPNGALRRVHAHDPSWQNWPLLEHAVIGNIVPDFPLINKSFNLSYSGVDL